MIKHLITSVIAGSTLLFGSATAAAINATPDKRSITDYKATVSTGHNLQTAKQMSAGKACLKSLPASAVRRTLAAPAPAHGLRADARRATLREATPDMSSAPLFESFEGCERYSSAMPEGWTSLSKGSDPIEDIDHWIGLDKIYLDYFMMTPPADGSMIAAVYYNDDVYKDEWLISPKVEITDEKQIFSFYWYTRPVFFYVIDRFHVDFDKFVFTNREVAFNVEVLMKAEGDEEWKVVYDFEKQFEALDYEALANIDYDEMQPVEIAMAPYVGQTVQFAFRYYGMEGNTFLLDAVSVDYPKPVVAYEPDYSRLFYGFSPDEGMWWMDSTIEFYPVNEPILWYNSSPNKKGADYTWAYYTVGDDGEWQTNYAADPDYLAVVYEPDYTDDFSLMNNFYYMPDLFCKGAEGGVSKFTSRSNFLQAGGTTEFGLTPEEYVKYTATQFDIIQEGFSLHLEGDDDLGFFLEPIFGYSENTDAWWEHYCYPTGANGRYAYPIGFANMFLPHPTAPLVVNGVNVAAYGTVSDEATFTLNIYTMDENGVIIEEPIATSTIRGDQIIYIPADGTRYYLALNFNLPAPVIFSSEGTGYGYIVEVTGFHDPENVEYFCPIQSITPNEFEWAFGFYHLKSSWDEIYNRDLTDQFGYVANFKDDMGRDLLTSFAIGLDAHYPWLTLEDNGEETFDFTDDATSFRLRSYFDASKLTFEAPDWVEVEAADRYRTKVSVSSRKELTADSTVPVKITGPGVKLTVKVPLKATNGVGSVAADKAADNADIYNAQGVLIRKNASPDYLKQLPAGLYIHGSRKVLVK